MIHRHNSIHAYMSTRTSRQASYAGYVPIASSFLPLIQRRSANPEKAAVRVRPLSLAGHYHVAEN